MANRFTLILITLMYCSSANAQFFKKVFHAVTSTVGAPVNAAVKIATAPTETVIKAGGVLVGANKPADVFDPLRDVAKSTGEAMGKTQPIIDFVAKPQEIMYSKAQEFSKKLGTPTEFVFDISTFTQRFYGQLAPTATKAVAIALTKQNPLIIVAAPLAAAVHAARERLYGSSKPLPDDVKAGLKDFFSPEILNKGRYAVGSIDITLPNFIGQEKKFQGDHYAVVVDDIIVFNVEPPTFFGSPWWWGHEVTHIKQYTEMGVELFAYNYLKDFGKSIENEADDNGNRVFAAQNQTRTLEPLSAIFKPSRTLYKTQETIISECEIDHDDSGAMYLITSKGNIYAVEPISGKYIHIGFSKPPVYAGSLWVFSTSKVNYSVLANGDIVTEKRITNPLGKTIGFQPFTVGHVLKIQ